jgi:hypothetical protein
MSKLQGRRCRAAADYGRCIDLFAVDEIQAIRPLCPQGLRLA